MTGSPGPISTIDSRIGLQFTFYNEFNGAGTNYDGNGRNASDNNSVYLYW